MIHHRYRAWRVDAAYARRAFILVVCFALGALLPTPAAASAAITLGATASGAPGSCPDDGTYVQGVVGGPPTYQVPSGNWVIVSWSVKGNSDVDAREELKLVTPASGTSYVVDGHDALREVQPNVLNVFSTRLPVHGGEQIALYQPPTAQFGNGPCQFASGSSGDRLSSNDPGGGDLQPGDTFTTANNAFGERLNLSVTLEPDADADGYGDETQDACPIDPGTQSACPGEIGQASQAPAICNIGRGGVFWQHATADSPGYAVPQDGVITSWATDAGSYAGTSTRLEVVREVGSKTTLVGQSASETDLQPRTVSRYSTRIPVKAGDRLGLFAPEGLRSACGFASSSSSDIIDAAEGDPAPGQSLAPGTLTPGARVNVLATVEPDADTDGFGDVTQDRCPGVPGSVQGCPIADLSIAETASANQARVGSDVSYTLSVQNNGPDAAPDVVVADTLASGTSLVSAGASGGSCTGGAARVSCDLHTLASGGTATVTLVVRLVSAGIKTNIATIGSATLTTAARNAAGAGDINQANNAASVTTAVTGPTAAAAISNARQSRTRWREPGKPRLAQISRGHAPFGTTFDFTLNISAVVRFDFTQALAGREVNGRCLAPTRRNEHERLCTRTVIRGTLTVAGHAGVNAVSFYGWLSRSERLKPGRYTVAISAIARHGAGAKTLTFTIVG